MLGMRVSPMRASENLLKLEDRDENVPLAPSTQKSTSGQLSILLDRNLGLLRPFSGCLLV